MEVTYSSDVGAGLRETLTSTANLDAVEGVLVLSTPDLELQSPEFESVLTSLSVPIFGGIFPEIIYRGETKATGALTIGLSSKPDVTTVSDLSSPETPFREALDPELPCRGYQTAFVLVDAHATNIEAFIEALFRTYSVELNFVGGGAGTLDADQQPCLFTNEGVVEDAAIAAAVPEPMQIGVKHGWQEVAGPFRVTDADGSTLNRLDGRPALSVYREVVDEHSERTVSTENFFEVAKSYPFGISRMATEQIVRDPFAVSETGSISCFGEVPEGEFLTILQGDPESLIDAARTAADHAVDRDSPPESLFFFDCISRVLYLESAFDRELAAVAPETVPVFGALTIGEIANDGSGHLDFYNKTAVVGALRDV